VSRPWNRPAESITAQDTDPRRCAAHVAAVLSCATDGRTGGAAASEGANPANSRNKVLVLAANLHDRPAFMGT
jgi:hypothetical protein